MLVEILPGHLVESGAVKGVRSKGNDRDQNYSVEVTVELGGRSEVVSVPCQSGRDVVATYERLRDSVNSSLMFAFGDGVAFIPTVSHMGEKPVMDWDGHERRMQQDGGDISTGDAPKSNIQDDADTLFFQTVAWAAFGPERDPVVYGKAIQRQSAGGGTKKFPCPDEPYRVAHITENVAVRFFNGDWMKADFIRQHDPDTFGLLQDCIAVDEYIERRLQYHERNALLKEVPADGSV